MGLEALTKGNISRRKALGYGILGLVAGALGMTAINELSPEKRLQRERNQYFFSYEEWKKFGLGGIHKYDKAGLTVLHEPSQIVIRNVKNIYSNPQRAYELLTDEEKKEFQKLFESEPDIGKIINKGSPSDLKVSLTNVFSLGILKPQYFGGDVYFKSGYEVEIDKKNPSLADKILIYLHDKYRAKTNTNSLMVM